MATRKNPRSQPISESELLASLRVAKDAVLIGGQALAFWLAHFNLPLPPGPRTFVSNDADFLGLLHHVDAFAKVLHARAEYPSRHQLSTLQGAVVKDTPTEPRILVDVLRSVVGLDAAGVRGRAIPVTHPSDANTQFSVMNPVDCLISRFENLRQLAEKRDEVGVWQAAISIAVCRSYLEKLLTIAQEPAAITAATRVLRLAGMAAGLQAFRNYQLDALAAISVERFTSTAFRTKQHAKMVQRIGMLRAAYQTPPRHQ
jgi:hypothetical protein